MRALGQEDEATVEIAERLRSSNRASGPEPNAPDLGVSVAHISW